MSMQEEYRKLSLWMTYSVSKNSKSLEERVIVIPIFGSIGPI